jgi:hypothetical protein
MQTFLIIYLQLQQKKMAAAATQLQITIITPQWLDLPENEKENTSSASSSVSEQQQQQQELENEAIQMITEENNKRTTTQKYEPIHEWQKQKFDEWLTKNSFNMYPTRDEKEKLAEMLSASYAQITRLFANQRRRTHKKGGKGTTIKEDETSPISLITTIPEILTTESPTTDPSEINKNSNEQMNEDTTINSKSRSLSPSATSSIEDNNIAAICSAVADQIHVDQENKKSFETQPIPPPTKKRPRKRKSKKNSCDEKLLETTVDEILNKISRKEPANNNDIQKEQTDIIQIKVDEKIEKSSSKDISQKNINEEMPPVEVATAATSSTQNSSSSEAVNNSLLSMVNEVVNQPPNALQLAAMGDVNPRLVEAMHLLNNGVSWTHPTILSVVIQIHQYQQQQREIQLAQQRAYLARAGLGSPIETSPPPDSESSYSHSSSKSTEELMSSLSPDECLAVNVLTDLAMAGNW